MKNHIKINKILICTILVVELFLMFSSPAYANQSIQLNDGFTKAWAVLFDEYKIHIAGFIGLGLVSSILAFIINLLKLSQASSNPHQRSRIIKELIVLMITTGLLGSVGVIAGLLYNIF